MLPMLLLPRSYLLVALGLSGAWSMVPSLESLIAQHKCRRSAGDRVSRQAQEYHATVAVRFV